MSLQMSDCEQSQGKLDGEPVVGTKRSAGHPPCPDYLLRSIGATAATGAGRPPCRGPAAAGWRSRLTAHGVLRQRADRHRGQLDDEGLTGSGGTGHTHTGVEDGDHVGRTESPEGHRPFQGGDYRFPAVDGLQVDSSSKSRARPVIPWAAAPLMKASAAGPRAQKVFSAFDLGQTSGSVPVSHLRRGRR